MAKKDKKRSAEKDSSEKGQDSRMFLNDLKQDTLHSILGIVFFVAAVLFFLPVFNKGGQVGGDIYQGLGALLGIGYYLVPLILVLLSISFFKDQQRSFPVSKMIGSILLFISGLGMLSLISRPVDPATAEEMARAASDTASTVSIHGAGGMIGDLIIIPILKFFDPISGFIILAAVIIVSLVVIFDYAIKKEHFLFLLFWRNLFGKKDTAEDADALKAEEIEKIDLKKKPVEEDEEEPAGVMASIKNKLAGNAAPVIAQKEPEKLINDSIQVSRKNLLLGKPYIPPPLSLLENDKGKPGVGDIKANANIIKRTFQNFGIDVEMDEVSIGPSVTRYALKPAEGVKLSKILGLQNNLSLALAAHPIRIEAPIPGKSLVGIEIPNSVKTTVGLGTLLAQEEFQTSGKPLLVGLGKGISGKSYFGNLAKMPHLLIAGATGSGKSVTIHAVITSLLYRNSPHNMRLIMIDPKRVELTLYNKIPHLLTPVITDAKKAILSLKWAAKEMDRRYDLLEKKSVRDIDSYHKNILLPALEQLKKDGDKAKDDELAEDAPDTMPYIVIIIDELADIMQTYPRELEAAIVRLAQMSRAVGIHLILSTQRPSVNVITGLIKANVPSRIALQVASQIDSRTILDARGAEELLGAGDMLYQGAEMSTPQRIQSAFLTETEVKKVVKYLVDTMDELPSEITLTGENANGTSGVNDAVFNSGFDDMGDPADDDDLYGEAKDIVMKAGKGSTSYIQRKLRVGYARAARLMDLLEERGVIGPADGAKPREVIGYSGGDTGGGSDDAENGDSGKDPIVG